MGDTSMDSRASSGPIEVFIRPPTSSPSQAPTSPMSTISSDHVVRGQRCQGHHDRAGGCSGVGRPPLPRRHHVCASDESGSREAGSKRARDVSPRTFDEAGRRGARRGAAGADPADGQRRASSSRTSRRPTTPTCSGCYDGTPLTERGWCYAGVLPDRIVIFRGPLLRMCREPRRAGRRGAHHRRPRDRPPLRHRRRAAARARLRLTGPTHTFRFAVDRLDVAGSGSCAVHSPEERQAVADVHVPEVDHVVQLIDRARRADQVTLHALITELAQPPQLARRFSTPAAIRWRPVVSAATATASTMAASAGSSRQPATNERSILRVSTGSRGRVPATAGRCRSRRSPARRPSARSWSSSVVSPGPAVASSHLVHLEVEPARLQPAPR